MKNNFNKSLLTKSLTNVFILLNSI